MKTFFGSDGPLAKMFSEYECRPQQVTMADSIGAALELGGHILVEAGTGVGKSLGYLVPIIKRIEANPIVPCREQSDGEDAGTRPHRLVVSTASKNLQAQLMEKELPMLRRVFPWLTFAMAVGTENYLCGCRLAAAIAELGNNPLLAGMDDDLKMIDKWSKETQTGLRMDLPRPVDHAIWSAVNRQSDLCRCKTFNPSEPCFYRKARAELKAAHVIVVNHHLLMSDLTLPVNVLPEYDYVVVDEIHSLEEIADDFFGHEITSSRVEYLVRDVQRVLRTGVEGLESVGEIREMFDNVKHSAEYMFDRLRVAVQQTRKDALRLRQPIFGMNEISEIVMISKLKDAAEWLKATADNVQDEHKKLEIRSLARRSKELGQETEEWLHQSLTNYVYQVILENQGKRIVAKSNPLHLAPHLGPALFEKDFIVIGTSATIATGNNMRFIRERIGLKEAREVVLQSPFNYQKQALLYIAHDLPEAKQGIDPEYYNAMVGRLADLLRISGGRALVLCTSNQSMKTLGNRLRNSALGLRILIQGEEMERHQMMEELKKNPRTVIVGVASFWQGVDIPGDALVMVIVVKLPFPNVGDPLFEARAEAIDIPNGRNFMTSSFMKLSLPSAIIRLKQGFGRLIRTSKDFGVVAILDPRVVTKKYGSSVLGSLPPVPICYDLGNVQNFLFHRLPDDPTPPPTPPVSDEPIDDEVPF